MDKLEYTKRLIKVSLDQERPCFSIELFLINKRGIEKKNDNEITKFLYSIMLKLAPPKNHPEPRERLKTRTNKNNL